MPDTCPVPRGFEGRTPRTELRADHPPAGKPCRNTSITWRAIISHARKSAGGRASRLIASSVPVPPGGPGRSIQCPGDARADPLGAVSGWVMARPTPSPLAAASRTGDLAESIGCWRRAPTSTPAPRRRLAPCRHAIHRAPTRRAAAPAGPWRPSSALRSGRGR